MPDSAAATNSIRRRRKITPPQSTDDATATEPPAHTMYIHRAQSVTSDQATRTPHGLPRRPWICSIGPNDSRRGTGPAHPAHTARPPPVTWPFVAPSSTFGRLSPGPGLRPGANRCTSQPIGMHSDALPPAVVRATPNVVNADRFRRTTDLYWRSLTNSLLRRADLTTAGVNPQCGVPGRSWARSNSACRCVAVASLTGDRT